MPTPAPTPPTTVPGVNIVWPDWKAPLTGIDFQTTPVQVARGFVTYLYSGLLFIGNDIWLIVPFLVGLVVLALLLRWIGLTVFGLHDAAGDAVAGSDAAWLDHFYKTNRSRGIYSGE